LVPGALRAGSDRHRGRVLLGHFYPKTGVAMKPLGDAFIALIRMMIAPVIFCTVVHGIASMSDLTKVGRVGLKALLYFEVVSTAALAIGLIVGEVIHPGSGFNIDPASLDPKAVASYATRAKEESVVAHLMAIIPSTYLDALVKGDLLQVLFVAILSGFAVARIGAIGERITAAIEAVARSSSGSSASSFKLRRSEPSAPWPILSGLWTRLPWQPSSADRDVLRHRHLVRAGRPGCDRLPQWLLDSALHCIHQGRAADRCRNKLIRDRVAAHDAEDGAPRRREIGRRAGHSHGLQLQPRRHQHLHDAGDPVPGAGDQHRSQLRPGSHHSADCHADLEGASGVAGAGFITLAATLQIIPDIPLQSLAILLGIDKFMSECRALTNLIGNGVATIVVSNWEGELDRDKLNSAMAHPLEFGEALEAEPV